MARTKKIVGKDGKEKVVPLSASERGRVLMNTTEGSKGSRSRFAIPSAAFRRVARGIVSQKIRISPLALDALQCFAEKRICDQVKRATKIMANVDAKGVRKTLNARYMMLVEEINSDAMRTPSWQ